MIPDQDTERRVVVTRDLGEQWLALIEGHQVVEVLVRGDEQQRWLGSIFKGRVARLVPGVEAAFVSVGLGRDLFTVCGDGGDVSHVNFEPGAEVIVQVVREAGGGKGHRASPFLTLPGWALVLAPHGAHRGISRKILDVQERDRLRLLLDDLAPEGHGLIARTAAAGCSFEQLCEERDHLLRRWERIDAKAKEAGAPALLYREDNAALPFVRDQLCRGLDEVVVDSGSLLEGMEDTVRDEFCGVKLHITRHSGPLPAVEAYGLDRAFEEASSRSCRLPGGGQIVIQSTEALVAIDVNSGRDVDGADIAETALRTNLEAAVEVARQVRLRDLSGLIVIDFIDMRSHAARSQVDGALFKALEGDRSKKRILPLSEFCLAQISRQRKSPSFYRVAGSGCAQCGARQGPPEWSARSLLRRLRFLSRPLPEGRFRVSAPPAVLEAARSIAELYGAESGLPPFGHLDWCAGENAVARC